MWSPVSFFFVVLRCHLRVTLFPYTTLFRSVRDAARADSEIEGRGVSVYSGARLEATGLLIERCAEAGLVVSNPGSVAVVSDAIVRDIAGSNRGYGIGAGSFDGARIEMQRIATV